MRIGMCTGIERLADAHAAGYDFAELGLAFTIGAADDESYARMREAILASPIPVEVFNCFLPAEVKVAGPSVDLPAVERYMHTALQRVAEVGASIVVFGSAGARSFPDGFPEVCAWEQLAVAARMAGDIADTLNLTIVMEPVCACRYFKRLDQGLEFVERLNHPRVQLLTDLYHMADANEPFANILTAAQHLLHVHLATPAIPETGDGIAYDFTGFLATLAQTGYAARITLEDNPGLLGGKQPPLTGVYRAMLAYVESCLPVTA